MKNEISKLLAGLLICSGLIACSPENYDNQQAADDNAKTEAIVAATQRSIFEHPSTSARDMRLRDDGTLPEPENLKVAKSTPVITYNEAVYCAEMLEMLEVFGKDPNLSGKIKELQAKMFKEALRLSNTAIKSDGSTKTMDDVYKDMNRVAEDYGAHTSPSYFTAEQNAEYDEKVRQRIKSVCLIYL